MLVSFRGKLIKIPLKHIFKTDDVLYFWNCHFFMFKSALQSHLCMGNILYAYLYTNKNFVLMPDSSLFLTNVRYFLQQNYPHKNFLSNDAIKNGLNFFLHLRF